MASLLYVISYVRLDPLDDQIHDHKSDIWTTLSLYGSRDVILIDILLQNPFHIDHIQILSLLNVF